MLSAVIKGVHRKPSVEGPGRRVEGQGSPGTKKSKGTGATPEVVRWGGGTVSSFLN